MADKKTAQIKHALRRAQERYGLDLNRQQYQALVRDIQNQKAEFLGRQSLRLTVWRLKYPGGLDAVVVYDSQRHVIVTFLPPDITSAWGVEVAHGNRS